MEALLARVDVLVEVDRALGHRKEGVGVAAQLAQLGGVEIAGEVLERGELV
jgi:hypothetical protein